MYFKLNQINILCYSFAFKTLQDTILYEPCFIFGVMVVLQDDFRTDMMLPTLYCMLINNVKSDVLKAFAQCM